MNDTIRIAVCQLTCHPAIIVNDRNFLREPFVPIKGSPSLSDLSRHSLDVVSLQSECERQYLDWHSRRLVCVLDWLARIEPPPDVVVFPECSVPIHDLHIVRSFASSHDAIVFAWTHTLRMTEEDRKHYEALDIPKRRRRDWQARAGETVLPIFCGKDTFAHVKAVPSVFEQTDVAQVRPELPFLHPLSLTIRGRTLQILPAVCAEAIQLNAVGGSYDLAVLVAYNDGIEPFLPTVRQNTRSQVPVVFCNDGRFGDSSINVVSDRRMTGIWWWAEPNNGLLPPGDTILVADVHLNSLAVQFGVANPSPPANLVALAPIVADLGCFSAAAHEFSTIESKSDNTVQHALLEGCLQRMPLSNSQRVIALQLKRLARVGTATSARWAVLGQSCILPAAIELHELEGSLAERCAREADKLILDGSLNDDTLLGKVARLKRRCLTVINKATTPVSESLTLRRGAETPLDREDEAREIRAFLDHPHQRVLLVTGLDDVGKETVVSLAIAQAGRLGAVWISLNTDATLRFLLLTLARQFRLPETGIASLDGITDIANRELVERIPLGSTVVITSAENLRDHGQWRETATPTMLTRFAEALERRQGKLILVSNVRVDLEGLEPQQIRRCRVWGLPDEHALLLFDQHLRRAGLEATHYPESDRRGVVKGIGCHPGAIILASEYVEQEGFQVVAHDLRKRGQVHTQIVRRILKRLRFTEEEQMVLSLLGEARIPLPPSVLNKVVFHSVMPTVQTLVHHSVIERGQFDHVVLTDLVRGFSDIPPVGGTIQTLFHKAAAEALAGLAADLKSPEQLAWAVESRYHAHLAGDPNLAPDVPGLLDGIVGAVQTLVANHEYERAKPIIDRLISTEKNAELYQLAAIVYARLGKTDQSVALVKEAFSLDKNRTWAVTEVGRLSLHVHRTDIAQECVELVKRTGHDSPYLATLEGKIFLRQSAEVAAAAAFRRAVALSEGESQPYDAWPHFFLGRTLLKVNQTEEAIDVLYRGEMILTRRRRPRRDLLIAIRTQLAIGYVYNGDLTSAKRIFDLIAADDSGKPEVIWAFALYRAAAGDAGKTGDLARETLRELNPNSAKDRYDRCQIFLFRALIYLGTGNKERASEEFSKAHQADPRNVFVLLRWANTLIELARQSDTDDEHQAARICAEHAKSLADKVLEFDKGNEDALALLEDISDDFSIV